MKNLNPSKKKLEQLKKIVNNPLTKKEMTRLKGGEDPPPPPPPPPPAYPK